MTFPTIIATNHGNSGANATSHTVNLPDGSNVTGRLLVVLFETDGSTTPSWPANWQSLSGPTNAQATTMEIRYKVIDGTEGYAATGATISISTGATSEGSAHCSYLIEGHDSTTNPPTHGTPASGTTTPYDCPNCNPGVAKDYLWLAMVGNDGNVAITGTPTNFTSFFTDRWANSNGCGAASSQQTLNASSLNPASASMGADGWIADTIAIHPGTEGIHHSLPVFQSRNYQWKPRSTY